MVAKGGRGSGKSHFFAGLMIDDAVAEPGNSAGGLRAVCIREVQRDLRESAKLLIESKLTAHGLGEADGFKVYDDRTKTPGDGLIIYRGMNSYTAESIKSLEGFKRAWWEEAHTATQTSIDLLRPTLRVAGSQLWWSYNPTNKNDPVDVMFNDVNARPSDSAVVTANWRDNPWWTQELERERQDCLRLKPEQYDHIWEGGHRTVTERAYYAQDLIRVKNEKRIGNVAADPLMTCRAFWDIGGTGAKADACAIWIAQFVGRELRILDYYEVQGQPFAAHVGWLRHQRYGSALCVLPHDGSTNDRVHDVSFESALVEAGFEVEVIPNQGRGAAKMRIEAARRLFPAIWFNELTTEAGREALGAYHERKDEIRQIGLGPEHDWSSHGADAFGLMCVAYEAPKQSKVSHSAIGGRPLGWMG